MIKQLTFLVAALAVLITSEVGAASCTTDADCMPYEVCENRLIQECPDGRPSCMPGESDEDCAARAMAWAAENCVQSEVPECWPRWWLPCETAADCSEGFGCDAGECVYVEAPCASDSDCPPFWTCVSSQVGEHCMPPMSPSVTGMGGGPSSGGSGSAGAGSAGALAREEESQESSSGSCAFVAAPARVPGIALFAWALVLVLGLRRRTKSRFLEPEPKSKLRQS